MPREQTPTSKALSNFARSIDKRGTWQFVFGTGSFDEDDFEVHAVSRGELPLLDPSEFGDIKDRVKIDHDPGNDLPRQIQFVRYVGDLVGLEMFTEILTDSLDGGIEGGGEDMIKAAGGALLGMHYALGGGKIGVPAGDA